MSDQSEQEIVSSSDQPKQLSDDQAAYWRANVLVAVFCGWIRLTNTSSLVGN